MTSLKCYVAVKRVVDYAVKIRLNAAKTGQLKAAVRSAAR
jgi:hypothetical protein